MPFALHHLTAQEQWDWIHRGDATAVELARHHLERIERYDPLVGAFARVDADRALEVAGRIDAGGGGAAPLAGVPIAEKELDRRAGAVSGSASRLLAHTPAAESDPVVTAIDTTGAVSLGATTAAEFGLTGFTEPAGRPAARNPWDTTTGAGGSSGGAAAAVAAGLVPFAVGSDGGGSVRIPAAVCGVVGLKPSRGRIPADPSSLAGLVVHGPIARTVADAAMLLDALVTPGGRTGRPGTATVPPDDGEGPFLGSAVRGEGRFQIGVLEGSPWDEAMDVDVDPESAAAVGRAIEALDGLGHGLEPVRLPGEGYDRFFRVLWRAGATRIPARTAEELALLEPFTRATLEAGRALSAEQLVEALEATSAFERRTVATFAPFDAILTPALGLPPVPLGWFTEDPDPDAVFDRQVRASPFTSLANVAGLPAIVLPVGASDTGRPAGVQLVGRPGGERALLAVGRQLERRFGWPHRHPPMW